MEIADKKISFFGGAIFVALRSTGIILLIVSHNKPLHLSQVMLKPP
jgi:hypothetical protein